MKTIESRFFARVSIWLSIPQASKFLQVQVQVLNFARHQCGEVRKMTLVVE
jgi:hypothetical protein